MTNIYSIQSDNSSFSMKPVEVDTGVLPEGYSSLATLKEGDAEVLFAFNKTTKLYDVYRLTSSAPYVTQILKNNAGMEHYHWDSVKTFVLGNKPYIMAYEQHRGHFEFYEIKADYTLSKAYGFMNQRSWPTQNFSEVEPIVITGLMYILCYGVEHGTVAIFSLEVNATSPPYAAPDTPPLNMLNVWYHQWARGWENFSFFTLGQSNFFFKINKAKLNVNIDHILDDPSIGSVEIGSYLQNQMPNALDVSLACIIPWAHGEPYLATYDGKTNATNLYHIHGDCQGWTNLNTTTVMKSSQMISYRVNDTSYILLYA